MGAGDFLNLIIVKVLLLLNLIIVKVLLNLRNHQLPFVHS